MKIFFWTTQVLVNESFFKTENYCQHEAYFIVLQFFCVLVFDGSKCGWVVKLGWLMLLRQNKRLLDESPTASSNGYDRRRVFDPLAHDVQYQINWHMETEKFPFDWYDMAHRNPIADVVRESFRELFCRYRRFHAVARKEKSNRMYVTFAYVSWRFVDTDVLLYSFPSREQTCETRRPLTSQHSTMLLLVRVRIQSVATLAFLGCFALFFPSVRGCGERRW